VLVVIRRSGEDVDVGGNGVVNDVGRLYGALVGIGGVAIKSPSSSDTNYLNHKAHHITIMW
jgi:hypothetical protein